jgi:hypothetical protein
VIGTATDRILSTVRGLMAEKFGTGPAGPAYIAVYALCDEAWLVRTLAGQDTSDVPPGGYGWHCGSCRISRGHETGDYPGGLEAAHAACMAEAGEHAKISHRRSGATVRPDLSVPGGVVLIIDPS